MAWLAWAVATLLCYKGQIFGPSCVCLRGITLHFSGQSYGFTFSTTKRFLFPYMANTFVAAVKVRDVPGHTLWWSSNELNILASSCLHSKVTMQILSVDYLLFRFTHFISYSHAWYKPCMSDFSQITQPTLGPNSLIISFSSGRFPKHHAGGQVLPLI